MRPKKIILIEDDPSLRGAIASFLKRNGYNVQSFSNAETAIKSVGATCDVILSDIRMKGLTGYDLLKHVHAKFPQIPVILMTAYGTIEKAVEAMKGGAYDFLVKPFSLSVLETAIKAALLDRQSTHIEDKDVFRERSDVVSTPIGVQRVSERFITDDPEMKGIIENLRRIASSKATVLIQGESGTGKELIARMIHEFSPRSERIFVAINCAAMPDTLLESELFGHEKGAFTGAMSRQIGKFELSNNGTILLDEISEMSLPMQTKLLRVLQECEVYRVGGIRPIFLNLRVIATTNRDLLQYMKDGYFREDLFYRVNVIPVKVPPLRDRGDDVCLLAEEFLREFAVLHAKKKLKLDAKIRRKIKEYPWNGNVRELSNAMERAVLVGNLDSLEVGSLSSSALVSSTRSSSSAETDVTLADMEREMILKTLDQCDGNKTKAANQLGISLRTLRNKLKVFGHSSVIKPRRGKVVKRAIRGKKKKKK